MRTRNGRTSDVSCVFFQFQCRVLFPCSLGSPVFVTDVLLGDDNTVCVTCDLQRYFNQLEKPLLV